MRSALLWPVCLLGAVLMAVPALGDGAEATPTPVDELLREIAAQAEALEAVREQQQEVKADLEALRERLDEVEAERDAEAARIQELEKELGDDD